MGVKVLEARLIIYLNDISRELRLSFADSQVVITELQEGNDD
jgi:hypothetical protein